MLPVQLAAHRGFLRLSLPWVTFLF
jgi:hypothetical protein